MITDPKLADLLQPLAAPEDDLALRRLQIDREKIISRMVEASLAPEASPRAARVGSRARMAAGLALAASLSLAAWGGASWWQRSASGAGSGIEVVALRGNVTRVQRAKAAALSVGATTGLNPEGTLETAPNAGARVQTSAGVVVELLENTKVSLGELGAARSSPLLRLDHGSVRCVIAHRPGRTFSVVTNAARVIDIGTIFSVSVDPSTTPPQTMVRVEEGEVQVESSDGRHRLAAGQSWASAREQPKLPAEAVPAVAPAAGASVTQSQRRDPVKRRQETLAAESKLLRSGLASEQKGELRAAISAFETLVARYPDSQLAPDAQAALARVKGRLESAP